MASLSPDPLPLAHERLACARSGEDTMGLVIVDKMVSYMTLYTVDFSICHIDFDAIEIEVKGSDFTTTARERAL